MKAAPGATEYARYGALLETGSLKSPSFHASDEPAKRFKRKIHRQRSRNAAKSALFNRNDAASHAIVETCPGARMSIEGAAQGG
jgi:hypothetical protein